MNDPWKEKDNDNAGQVITLLHEACTRTLTIPEQQLVQKALASPLTQTVIDTCELEPKQLAELLDNNHLMALKVVQAFLKQPNGKEYLQALATVPVSSNCIEVMHLLTLGGYVDDDFFIHVYISNIIRSAEMMPEGPRKDTHVRMVARFIQSLLDKTIIQIADYMIEIQSFCVGHFRFKGVADLYRLASAEAQRIGIEPIESSR
ncbi:hypothetical protein K492DRAFT_58982 [Lichtheimia hyalospora FSU 10163]|nr:hypothetical protein K492DRAFT_58982 [Lichtheimia hyalospora FSU 10163]